MADPVSAGLARQEPIATEEEKEQFDVVLKAIGPNKINVIKALWDLRSLGLKEAKELAESAQSAKTAEATSKVEAMAIRQRLEEAEASAEIQ